MLKTVVVLVAILFAEAVVAAEPRPEAATPPGRRLNDVATWGYQLQKVDPAEIAASPFDLVVIDYSRSGTDDKRFTPAEVKGMQVKPDGRRRIVLAYMSIGEAEDYRFYWRKNWVEAAPLRGSKDGAPPLPGTRPETVNIPRLIAPGWLGQIGRAHV